MTALDQMDPATVARWIARKPAPPEWSMAWPMWIGTNREIDKWGHAPVVKVFGRTCSECDRPVYRFSNMGFKHEGVR